MPTQEAQVMPVTPMKHFCISEESDESTGWLSGGLWDPVPLLVAIEACARNSVLGSDDLVDGLWVERVSVGEGS